jgi:hypothetical protein
MFHTPFATDAAVAQVHARTRSWNGVGRLGGWPRCEAGVVLQSQQLLDQRTRWTRPGGPSGRLGCLLASDRG